MINIKGGGVHQYYMTFSQQCSINGCKTVFFKINFGIKRWRSAMVSPFKGKHCHFKLLNWFTHGWAGNEVQL